MFDIDAPIDDKHPELGPQAERAARYITRGAEEHGRGRRHRCRSHAVRLVDVGGAPRLVMLHQSGMLAHGPDYRTLAHFHGALMLKGAAPQFRPRRRGRSDDGEQK